MREQLKPCPACNRVEYEIRASESSLNVHIMCNCRRFSTMWHQSVDACVAEWNTRPLEDALRAANARQSRVIEAQGEVIKAMEDCIFESGVSDDNDNILWGAVLAARARLEELTKAHEMKDCPLHGRRDEQGGEE